MQHPQLLVRSDRAKTQAHGEPIELTLRQRKGAVLLDRVLGGDHEERVGQRVPHPVHGDRVLFERLHERRLGARRGAVEFVEQHHLGEDRAGHELEPTIGGPPQVGASDVGRQHVRGRLNPSERTVDGVGEGPSHHGLAAAGHVFEQK